MATILVAYASKTGATAEIADWIGEALRRAMPPRRLESGHSLSPKSWTDLDGIDYQASVKDRGSEPR